MVPKLGKYSNKIWQSLCVALLGVLGASVARPALPALAASQAGCRETSTKLCLLDRFAVEATWRGSHGLERVALAVPLVSSASGAFAFFGREDADLLVRVVEERPGSGHFAVEAGAASGAPFGLRVVDTLTGAEWTRRSPRGRISAFRANLGPTGPAVDDETPDVTDVQASTVDRRIAEFLEAAGSGSGAPAAEPFLAGADCRASAHDLCLLGGRLRVSAKFGGTDQPGKAWALAGSGDTGLFSASEAGAAEVAIRVVDGRAVNGHFWLLYSVLSKAEVEIELVDLASGNRRQFVKAAGFLANAADVEALSASAAVVNVTLDTARAVTRAIGVEGGVLEAVDAQGTRFNVSFPAQALNLKTDITVTPVLAIAGLPLSGGLRGAVRIEPEGLVPARTVRLTVTPAPLVPNAQQVTFAFRGLSGEFFLTPPAFSSAALVVPVHRLGGYGLGAGTSADLVAQLARLPTREEDHLNQRLAGLLLPLRRAGTHALPPTVSQLLVQEYNARIKARLAAVRKGDVAKYYARLRNWTLSARDTGLAKKESAGSGREADTVALLEARLRAAVLEGIRWDFLRYTSRCIASDRDALFKAFSAFAELGREGGLKPGDAAYFKRCALFELEMKTQIQYVAAAGSAFNAKETATAEVQLTFSNGTISGSKRMSQTSTLKVPPCTTKMTEDDPPMLDVARIDMAALNFWDNEELPPLVPELHYRIVPSDRPTQTWTIRCPNTSRDFKWLFAWPVPYLKLHLPEIEAGLVVATLPPQSAGNRLGERLYERTEQDIIEKTTFVLRHMPR